MPPNDSPNNSLAGKVALVTGAGRGIGHGIALELSKRGAAVVINYAHSKEGSENLVTEIESFGGQAIAIQADISKTPEIKRLFKEAIDHFGRLDVVCSNAGKEVFCPEQEVTEELYDEVFALNTRAQFFVAQQALISLNEGGRIVLMSSVAATMSGIPNHALYAGSKAAVEGFTRSFAKDCGPKRITVNAIAPVSHHLRV
jgi:3-oxoacyl-[acyl-carrier protein] reductase